MLVQFSRATPTLRNRSRSAEMTGHVRRNTHLSQTYGGQLLSGQAYTKLRQVTGIYLLNFKLFENPNKAVWCIEPRDCDPPHTCPAPGLQWHIVELRKADRLDNIHPALAAWITFLKHAQEEQKMSQIDYPPVLEMHQNLKALSADPRERMLARDRERALQDEMAELSAAKEKGMEEGIGIGVEKGIGIGVEKGIDMGVEQSVQRLMARGMTEQAARAMLAPVEPGNDS